MAWTDEQQAQAKSEGWRLVETIDNGKTHPYLMVTTHGPRFATEHEAGIFVVRQARLHSSFHQHALRAITQSRVQPTKSKR